VLDEQAYAVGDGVGELGEWLGRHESAGLDAEPSRAEPVIEEVFGEQGHTTGALMDERHQLGVGFTSGPRRHKLADLVDP
jgi:hypothetical protein